MSTNPGEQPAGTATSEQPADSQSRAQAMEDAFAAEFTGEPEPDQTDEPAAEAASEEAAETSDGLEEVEFEGENYRLPKKIKEGLLRDKDYRAKTQEIARQREALDLREQSLKRDHIERQFMDSAKEDLQQFHALSAQIQQYEQLNWAQLSSEEMLRAKVELDRLERERSKRAQAIEGKRGEFLRQQDALQAELVQKGQQILRSRIPGFSEATSKEIVDYAISEGYSAEEVKSITEPRYVMTLWKARQFDKLQAARQSGQQTAQRGQARVVKPGASNPMPQQVKNNLAYRKAVRAAPTSSAKARVMEDHFAAGFERRR